MYQMIIIYTVLVTSLIFLYCLTAFQTSYVDMLIYTIGVAHGVATSERNAILGIF